MEYHTKTPKTHLGRKIGRMREILGIKQEVVADKLGVSQQKISYIEQSEEIDDKMLGEIAEALGVNPQAIKNFDEDKVIYNIQNNYEGANQGATGFSVVQNSCIINPMEKWLEAIEENKKLYEELLKSEREKVALLEKLLDKK